VEVGKVSEIDISEIAQPSYVYGQGKEVSLRIREFPGAEPIIVRADPEWTVGQ
jgi:hypothetical protein